jgi:hypothetical protein
LDAALALLRGDAVAVPPVAPWDCPATDQQAAS